MCPQTQLLGADAGRQFKLATMTYHTFKLSCKEHHQQFVLSVLTIAQSSTPTPSSSPLGETRPPKRKPLTTTAKDLRTKVRNQLSSLTPHEDIYTLPNLLTLSRLIAAPAVGYLVLHDQHVWAVSLFAYAGITDLVDGWIARRWKLQTVVGSVVDPMADKILMTILTVCLAIKGGLPGTNIINTKGAAPLCW